MNLAARLDPDDRARGALPRARRRRVGLGGQPPRFALEPLPGAARRSRRGWSSGSGSSSRCATPRAPSVRSSPPSARGASPRELADMLFAAATDHRYLDVGHALDFVNKAFEALDIVGWERAEPVLALVAGAGRRRRADGGGERLAQPGRPGRAARAAFAELPERSPPAARRGGWDGRAALVERDPRRRAGGDPRRRCSGRCATARREVELASAVTFAAAMRIARFPTSNEFGDWDTALHTFTFANAVEQGLRRSPSPELLRGVFDAAMSVYLDRFLNVPATRLPAPERGARSRGAARPSSRAARPAAAGRRGGRARRPFLAAGGEPRDSSPRSARRCPRGPRLPHHPVRRGGRAPARAARAARATAAALIAAARYLAAHATDDALAAPDIRDRPAPAPRREAVRGRGLKELRAPPTAPRDRPS